MMAGLLMTSASAFAQQKDGGISQQMLSDFSKLTTTSVADKALFNAMASNKIHDLAKNLPNQGQFDTYFSVETPKQSITDQISSGRCWMFSGMNVIRSNFTQRTDSVLGFVPAKNNVALEFSQNHLFFYDQLEKANLFLQGIIETAKKPIDDTRVQFFFRGPVNDGGTFCGVADLTEKYGIVPKEIVPETYSADNTSRMAQLVRSKLREQGLVLRDMVAKKKSAKEMGVAKNQMLGEIYRMLCMTLGKPVTEFTYAFKDKDGKTVSVPKKYTPKSFYRDVVGESLNGTFIMVMNDPRHEYYKTYEVEYNRHTYDGHNWKYLNLPMEEIEKLAIASLKDGRKMYSSYDVGKQLDRNRGYCDVDNYDYATLMGTDFKMDKAQRISTFDSGSTHAMTLAAVDLDENGNARKWKVENSWGASWGQNGCLIMTDNWFREYMFRLVVDKKYVPENILKMAQQKPVMLLPEDPLFQYDE